MRTPKPPKNTGVQEQTPRRVSEVPLEQLAHIVPAPPPQEKSKGINLMALFGLDKEKDEEKRLQKLAELSFNRDEGIKHFGRQQQLLQIEA